MRRRNFILGGGLLASLSLGATATNASLADTVSVPADFRVFADTAGVREFQGTITIDDNTADTDTRHVWDYEQEIHIDDTDIDTITVDYPSGTNFDAVGTGDVTVEFFDPNSGPNGRLEQVTVQDITQDGSSATFDIESESPNGDAIVEIDQVTNPESGSYEVEMGFLSGDDGITYVGEIGISSEGSVLEVVITDVPVSVSAGDDIDVDYEIENTGDQPGDDLVELIVDNNDTVDSASVSLDDGDTDTGLLSYTTDRGDPEELDVTVATSDDSATETVAIGNTWSLELGETREGRDSEHTWNSDLTVFEGDIDTITTEYPDSAEFDGLDQSDITVELSNQNSDTLEEIDIAADNYSGSTATFDLDDFDTTLDGEAQVIIDGISNPEPEGEYEATITLDGADDTISATVSFETTFPGGRPGPR